MCNMTYLANKYFHYLPTSRLDTLHICKTFGEWELLQLEELEIFFDFPFDETLQMSSIRLSTNRNEF